jgi:mono/diheme cytochrome c family protein
MSGQLKSDLRALLKFWRWLLLILALGAGLGLGAMGVGALIVVEFGLFNTTSTKPHNPIVGWGTHATFVHSTRLRAQGIKAPAQFTQSEVDAGFVRYDTDCAMCHGGPGVPRARWVRGMTPTPPFLLDAAEKWTAPQLYWIVGQGVKMTGMPAWSETRSSGEIWDTVAFLEALPKLSPHDYAQMKASHETPRTKPSP